MHRQSIENQILANPHSDGPAASRTESQIDQVKKEVLDFFHAHAGPKFGYQLELEKHQNQHQSQQQQTQTTGDCHSDGNDNGDYNNDDDDKEEDYHPGYDVIFTSGTTQALQIVAENFAWDNGNGNGKDKDDDDDTCRTGNGNSVLVYSHNSHTSVVGMRESAMKHGATFQCKKLADIEKAGSQDFVSWGRAASLGQPQPQHELHGDNSRNGHNVDKDGFTFVEHGSHDGSEAEAKSAKDPTKHLLVFPLECNFSGTRSNAQHIIRASRRATSKCGKWYSMLDIAKAASTSSINLRKLDPDFACVSFYKIFGAPTGIGALFVKRSSKQLLVPEWTNVLKRKRRYFGGGSVDIQLPTRDFVRPRSSFDSLVHGTINFRSILSLRLGLQDIAQLGMDSISTHTQSLALECCFRFKDLRHYNDRPVIELYGEWSAFQEGCSIVPGPALSFNIIRSDGSYVGYNEVSKLAALSNTPIQLRTGCFCNPGACQEYLNIDEEKARDNYERSGKVCGDHLDVLDGSPTGAIRVSIGKDSIWEDIDVLVRFIKRTFVNRKSATSLGIQSKQTTSSPKWNGIEELRLQEIYVFPIKSCAAMEVDKWQMDDCGKLLFDREFALVDSAGTALRLSRYPKMAFIRPILNTDKMTLEVSAPARPNLVIDLNADAVSPMKDITVCGNKCNGKLWGSHAVSSWFTEYLGVQCWLARASGGGKYALPLPAQPMVDGHPEGRYQSGFENEAPLLLLSMNSINVLNEVLVNKGSQKVNARYFRPNLVVTTITGSSGTNPEDRWKSITIPNKAQLSVTGQCARCGMVDINPESGMKGKTLRTLSEYRRHQGQITFGIFLKRTKQKGFDQDLQIVWIRSGDTLTAIS
mmetsp:Transcript_11616/g.17420  ORF Transcript_11616/g.17420 Transcript_11616/m.17420 type:complete len:866 (-) Transcript_11616:51-2648(-)